ncbi:MAG: DUF4166 domain-containing protein [Hyphomicrobiaceae bacterium]
MILPLYRRLLGAEFDALPAKVRELHDVQGQVTWSGRAEVQRGTSLLARIIGTIAGLPPSSPGLPLEVVFTPDATGEHWRRTFGRHVFQTHQRLGNGVILERIGPSTAALKPKVGPAGLSLTVAGLSVLGVPVPRSLLAEMTTLEHEVDGRYAFEVEAHLPLIGLLVRYKGWLERVAA